MTVTKPQNSTFVWTTRDCFDMKDVVPICQYPLINFSQAFPESKGYL